VTSGQLITCRVYVRAVTILKQVKKVNNMELTKFRYNIKSDAFVDLYGNILRVCSDCNQLKDHNVFKGGTKCKTCISIGERIRGGVAYLERKNKAVQKHYAIKRLSKPSKEDKEKEYYAKHNGKNCKIYYNKCLVTDNIYISNRNTKIPLAPNVTIKGDYKSSFGLATALKSKGKYHKCSQCSIEIDLTINGTCYSNSLVFCTKECRVLHAKETKHNSSHRRRARLSLNNERISRSKVFRNDNYTCYICNVKVILYKDIKDIRHKKDAATIDHVIALANGGTHTYSNIKTCCSWCNSNKSDK
jgi:hypothetical protein